MERSQRSGRGSILDWTGSQQLDGISAIGWDLSNWTGSQQLDGISAIGWDLSNWTGSQQLDRISAIGRDLSNRMGSQQSDRDLKNLTTQPHSLTRFASYWLTLSQYLAVS